MQRKGYKYLEHTADVEYVAHGKSVEECITNALMAMFDTQSYISKVSSSKSKNIAFEVKDSASSMQDLLWYALQDTLSLSDSKAVFPYKVSRIKIIGKGKLYTINARVLAKERDDKSSKLDVKGVSRYNLGLKHNGGKFEATVVLDV